MSKPPSPGPLSIKIIAIAVYCWNALNSSLAVLVPSTRMKLFEWLTREGNVPPGTADSSILVVPGVGGSILSAGIVCRFLIKRKSAFIKPSFPGAPGEGR